MSKYGIFKNAKGKTLVYYPCPKNANSSAKLFFLKHLKLEDNFVFISDKIPLYKQNNKHFENKKNLVNFLPSKQPFKKIKADLKCCIIRDPVKRFVSSYKNRILYHQDTEFHNHSIDMILLKLEKNIFENKHFLPQIFFLGEDLSYYDCCANVNDIKKFELFINSFFEKNIDFPKIQTGGKEQSIFLNDKQIKRIKLIYKEDYNLLKNFPISS